MTNPLHRAGGFLCILSAVLLLMFWTFFAVFLPMNQAYLNWVMDGDWLWINIIGYFGAVLGLLAFTSIMVYQNNIKPINVFAFICVILGSVLLSGLLFFETFILKGIAKVSPNLIDQSSGFYQEFSFRAANLLAGISFSVGFIIWGVLALRSGLFKKWKIVLLIIGSPLFSLVIMPGNFRLVGVLFYSIAFIGMGYEMIVFRKKHGL
jgi:hypothetical protein